ncbi:MAG: DUF2797 domain-containing protein [Candidatus Helarchaeota archaeon]
MLISSEDENLTLDSSGAKGNAGDFSLYPQYLIRYYSYHPISDIYVPHLDVKSNFGETQLVPFIGHVFLKLSHEHYCENCLQILQEPTNYCFNCLKELGLDFLYCVKKGPGYGTGICSTDAPKCGSDFSQQYCRREYGMYLALFGKEFIKVGISRIDRILYRLIEQGASHAIIFRRQTSENTFIDMHRLEGIIARQSGLKDAVTFDEKVPIFESDNDDLSNEILKLKIYEQVLKSVYGLTPIREIDLREMYTPFPIVDKKVKELDNLNGTITCYRGNVGVIEMDGKKIAFDFNKLSGKRMLNVVG